MPILRIEPPEAATHSFQESLVWLAGVGERFADLHEANEFDGRPLPPPHAVEIIGLDEFLVGWRPLLPIIGLANRMWRFFVSGPQIQIAVVDVIEAETAVPKIHYEFLAFREGPPIGEVVEAYGAVSNFAGQTSDYGVRLVKVPGVFATFFWLRKLDERNEQRSNWGFEDWLVPIPPAPTGFVPSEPYRPVLAYELLRDEVVRVLNTNFVRGLARRPEPPLSLE